MPISLSESLAVFGNSNHLNGFLHKYEKQIESKGEYKMELTQAPNYFAWINISSGQVFYQIREMIYVNTNDDKWFDSPYKTLLDYLFKKHNPNAEQIESILLFAKIRHLLVHKGFPNPHSAPSTSPREIASGYSFDSDEVNKLADRLQKPECYPELKKHHRIAMESIGTFQEEFKHDFGFMQISKTRDLMSNLHDNCAKNKKADLSSIQTSKNKE